MVSNKKIVFKILLQKILFSYKLPNELGTLLENPHRLKLRTCKPMLNGLYARQESMDETHASFVMVKEDDMARGLRCDEFC